MAFKTVFLFTMIGMVFPSLSCSRKQPPQPIFHQATIDAAIQGDEVKLKALLDKDQHRANARGHDQEHNFMSALHAAARSDQASCIRYLASKGANLYAYDNTGYTPLHLAVSRDNADAIRALVKAGSDLEMRTWTHKTSLHIAALFGKPATISLLLDLGADVNATTSDQEVEKATALHLACFMGDKLDKVKILLKYGADTKAEARLEPNAAPVTAEQSAKVGGSEELLELLRHHNK